MPCKHCGSGAHPTRLHGISDDIKDNRWSLLSADLREIEQRLATLEHRVELTGEMSAMALNDASALNKRLIYLEQVCEQCILEHQGRGQ